MSQRKAVVLQKTSVNVERDTFRRFKKWLIDHKLEFSPWIRQKMLEELDTRTASERILTFPSKGKGWKQ